MEIGKTHSFALSSRYYRGILRGALMFFLSFFIATQLQAQDRRVTGQVLSETGSGLAGASVQVQNSTIGTNTDSLGNFALTVPAGARLVVSYVGYAPQTVTVGDQTNITVVLTATGTALEQVVVVGYGTQRRIDVTGSVAQVRAEEITRQPVINPVSGLQGRVAGVQITNSGAPGSSPQIRIRGLGTVYGSANPLYVVDGVWFDDISFLNPADIENISILKDASSEAIYGIRAANGVVLITTRKGRAGRPTVAYTGYVGVQRVTNQVEMANANQYATLLNEKNTLTGGGQIIDPSAFGEGTNWYDVILRNALIHNHQVSISGGAERSTYSFSLGYLKQEGIVKTHDFDRLTARLQNDFQLNDNIRVGYTVTGSGSTSNDINGGIFYQAFVAPPVIPVRYSDGSYGDPGDYPTGNFANPQVTLDFFNQESKNYRLTGNVFGELKFLRNFTFRTSLGGEYGEGEVLGYSPVFNATTVQNSNVSRLNVSRADTRNWILENTLTFDRRFDDHNVRVLLGQGAQRYKYYRVAASAQDVPYTTEGDLYLRLGSTGNSTATDEGDLSTIASYFTRVNYSFQNKYLLTASLRADGSSKFFGDQRWGYFPSVGVGWVISEEAFMQNVELFDNLKLRGSWGKVGNAAVPSNLAILRVTQTPQLSAFFGQPSLPYTGGSINMIVPPTTYWERGVGTDIGLEAALLNNRLNVEVAFYNRKTEEAIFDVPVLGSVGTGSGRLIANQATFQNRGYEFTLNWRDNISNDVSYSISGNLGINDNKVLSTATGANPIYAGGGGIVGGALSTRTVVGQPIGQFFGYQVGGIFQTNAEAAGSAQPNAKAGDFRYVDQNKDNVINALDRVVLGNPNPKYTYGLNTNFTYRQFDLVLDFQGVAGVDIYNANIGNRFGNENYTKEFFENRWHGQGTSNTYPSANLSGDNLTPSDFYVEDGSYFRVRNAQIGYNFSSDVLSSRIKNLRVYINAQNPLNFFKYRGFSPEVGGTPTNAGIDYNVYPLFATYNFGVNLTF